MLIKLQSAREGTTRERERKRKRSKREQERERRNSDEREKKKSREKNGEREGWRSIVSSAHACRVCT